MAWTTVTSNANYELFEHSAVSLDSDVTLDKVVIKPGIKDIFWQKQVSGTPNAADQIIVTNCYVVDPDGVDQIMDPMEYFRGGAIVSGMNASGGVIDNTKQVFQLVHGAGTLGAAVAQRMLFPQISIEFDYDSGTESGGASYDVFRLWVYYR